MIFDDLFCVIEKYKKPGHWKHLNNMMKKEMCPCGKERKKKHDVRQKKEEEKPHSAIRIEFLKSEVTWIDKELILFGLTNLTTLCKWADICIGWNT